MDGLELALPLLSPLATATVVALVARSQVAVAALVGTILVQSGLAFLSVRVVRGRWMAWYYAPLEVVRTYLTLLCWGRAWLSRRSRGEGHEFILGRDSAIVPAKASGWARLASAARA